MIYGKVFIKEDFNMENKEVMFVGFDIHNFAKGLCDQFLGDSPDMTDGEKRAYRLGITNTLSLLNQTLNEMIAGESDDYLDIAVHIPNLNIMTEFATIEEIQEYIN